MGKVRWSHNRAPGRAESQSKCFTTENTKSTEILKDPFSVISVMKLLKVINYKYTTFVVYLFIGYRNDLFGEDKELDKLRADSPPHVGIVTALLRAHANRMISRLVIERPRSCGWRRLGRGARERG